MIRTINTVIFPTGSKTGTKKTLTFKRTEDFTIKLQYKNAVAPWVVITLHFICNGLNSLCLEDSLSTY
jgi:hypothetical protein